MLFPGIRHEQRVTPRIVVCRCSTKSLQQQGAAATKSRRSFHLREQTPTGRTTAVVMLYLFRIPFGKQLASARRQPLCTRFVSLCQLVYHHEKNGCANHTCGNRICIGFDALVPSPPLQSPPAAPPFAVHAIFHWRWSRNTQGLIEIIQE